jgi:hypothetical protein
VKTACVAVAALVATAVSGCSDDQPETGATTTRPPSTAPTTTTPGVPSSNVSSTTAPATASTAPPDDALADGQHVVYLVAVDETSSSVTFDLVELLTGQEAADAYLEDTGEVLDGEQFYIRDRNDRERTLPADPAAGPYSIVDLESCCEPIEVGFAGLAAVRAQADQAAGADTPFTIAVQGGLITSAVQMYLP